jgi:uncharacterized protein
LRPLRTALIVWAVATAVAAGLYQVARFVPFVDKNLTALVAVVFLYLPVAVTWRRKQDLAEIGFTARPLGKGLAIGVGLPAVVFPIFFFGFYFFYRWICSPEAPAWAAQLAPRGWCLTFTGWDRMHPPAILSWDMLERAFVQVVVVALPEELLFRGYLLGELEKVLPPRRRLLGGGIGWALVVSAALFALAHLLVDGNPRRLAVFFPGLLFGWMRSSTRSILAGTAAHAASNLYIEYLGRTFFAAR